MPKKRKRNSNIFEIKPIKFKNDNELPLRGSELISEPYANVFLCAKTNSGKTTVIHHLLKNTIDKRCEIFLFCATCNIDKAWQAICDSLEKRHVTVHKFISIYEGKENVLTTLLEQLRQRDEAALLPPERSVRNQLILTDNDIQEAETTPERKPTDRVPERLIIFDDLSIKELRDKSICTLLKANRHYHARCIISSQHVIHLAPDAFSQLYSVHVWPGFSKRYIDLLHDRLSTHLEPDQLYMLYKMLTEKPYNFMSIYLRTGEVRHNFNLPAINIQEIFSDEVI